MACPFECDTTTTQVVVDGITDPDLVIRVLTEEECAASQTAEGNVRLDMIFNFTSAIHRGIKAEDLDIHVLKRCPNRQVACSNRPRADAPGEPCASMMAKEVHHKLLLMGCS